ncbi:MAG: cysteine desulfurase [Butyrivibrio sp.]|nr:cysteine desulfurase [Butyrivibrio sp.]
MIYLDNAATTKIDTAVKEVMLPFYEEEFGNPSTFYALGGKAKKALRNSREVIATAIGAAFDEIFFTSGGTESDNWAIIGTADMLSSKGKHIITSAIEHHAVLDTCKYLEEKGFEITYLPVDKNGIVNPKDVEKAIRNDTILISVMMANNEIGTIEPIAEIGKVAHEKGVFLHTDAVQAFGHIPIDVNEMNIDMMSVSGHKIYGPKGIGFLYIRNGIKMGAFIHGGGQERGRRSGTENVPGIVGLSKATEIAITCMESEKNKISALKEHLKNRLIREIPGSYVNGDSNSLPGILNVCFKDKASETALIMLDMQGIYCSAGSACATGSLENSHVLEAIGLSNEDAQRCLRFSIGRFNTADEIDQVVEALKKIYL